MPFTGPMEDRVAIRELHATYADAASRIDKEQWLACWTDEAVWAMSFGDVCGKEEMSAKWDELFRSMTAMAFYSMTAAITVHGDRATARDHVREIARFGDQVVKFAAWYDDELVRNNGVWRFTRRTYNLNIREPDE